MKVPFLFYRLCLITLACVPLFSCGTPTPHRPFNHGAENRIVHTLSHSNHEVQLAFLEFDDMGELWRTKDKISASTAPSALPVLGEGTTGGASQLGTVLDALAAKVKKGPVHLVIYVHGWNNDAQSGNGNLESFKNVLLAAKNTKKDKNASVFGVYFGWRGHSSWVPGIDYFNRDAAAARIGRVQATGALQALCTTAHLNPQSRVIAVGHSMGAVILLRAVAQPLAEQIAIAAVEQRAWTGGMLKKRTPLKIERAMADTVVLVNPADNGILGRQLVGMLKDFDTTRINSKTKRQLPLITSVTSTGDFATGTYFKGVALIARKVFRGFMPHAAGDTSSSLQERATTTALGFYTPIHNAAVLDNEGKVAKRTTSRPPKTAPKIETFAKSILTNTALQQTRGSRGLQDDAIPLWMNPTGRTDPDASLEPFYLTPPSTSSGTVGQMGNTTPFWILQVPQFIIHDHGDIWTPNFTGLVAALDSAGRVVRDQIRLPAQNKITTPRRIVSPEPSGHGPGAPRFPSRVAPPPGLPDPTATLDPAPPKPIRPHPQSKSIQIPQETLREMQKEIDRLPTPDLSAPPPTLKLTLPQ